MHFLVGLPELRDVKLALGLNTVDLQVYNIEGLGAQAMQVVKALYVNPVLLFQDLSRLLY